jgi:hypothetical protein
MFYQAARYLPSMSAMWERIKHNTLESYPLKIISNNELVKINISNTFLSP